MDDDINENKEHLFVVLMEVVYATNFCYWITHTVIYLSAELLILTVSVSLTWIYISPHHLYCTELMYVISFAYVTGHVCLLMPTYPIYCYWW